MRTGGKRTSSFLGFHFLLLCKHCREVFDDWKALKTHLKRIHTIKMSDGGTDRVTSNGKSKTNPWKENKGKTSEPVSQTQSSETQPKSSKHQTLFTTQYPRKSQPSNEAKSKSPVAEAPKKRPRVSKSPIMLAPKLAKKDPYTTSATTTFKESQNFTPTKKYVIANLPDDDEEEEEQQVNVSYEPDQSKERVKRKRSTNTNPNYIYYNDDYLMTDSEGHCGVSTKLQTTSLIEHNKMSVSLSDDSNNESHEESDNASEKLLSKAIKTNSKQFPQFGIKRKKSSASKSHKLADAKADKLTPARTEQYITQEIKGSRDIYKRYSRMTKTPESTVEVNRKSGKTYITIGTGRDGTLTHAQSIKPTASVSPSGFILSSNMSLAVSVKTECSRKSSELKTKKADPNEIEDEDDDEPSSTPAIPLPKEGYRLCPECQTYIPYPRFQSKTAWFQHLEIHTEVRPFVCPYCIAAFKEARILMSHVSKEHTGAKDFECEVCKKSFMTYTALRAHERNSFTCRDRSAIKT